MLNGFHVTLMDVHIEQKLQLMLKNIKCMDMISVNISAHFV